MLEAVAALAFTNDRPGLANMAGVHCRVSPPAAGHAEGVAPTSERRSSRRLVTVAIDLGGEQAPS